MSAALFGGSVEVTVCTQRQATDRGAAVNGIEVIENLVGTGRRDLKNKTLTVGAASGDGSIHISVPALRHNKRILRATTGPSEIQEIGIGLGRESGCGKSNHKENLGKSASVPEPQLWPARCE